MRVWGLLKWGLVVFVVLAALGALFELLGVEETGESSTPNQGQSAQQDAQQDQNEVTEANVEEELGLTKPDQAESSPTESDVEQLELRVLAEGVATNCNVDHADGSESLAVQDDDETLEVEPPVKVLCGKANPQGSLYVSLFDGSEELVGYSVEEPETGAVQFIYPEE